MDIEMEENNWIPLLDNPHSGEVNELRNKQLTAFGRVLDVMDDLRCKCPWDRKQTFGSLRPQTIEEVYELSDAVSKVVSAVSTDADSLSSCAISNEVSAASFSASSSGDDSGGDSDALYRNICKELGDVLLHIVFYAKLGQEQGRFDMTDICNALVDKLVYRHPHVYGSTAVGGSDDVVKNWEQLKTKEKDGNRTVLSGVPSALPSIIKAYRIQDKARAVGFDWEHRDDVWEKVAEELEELKSELALYSAQRDSVSSISAPDTAASSSSAQRDSVSSISAPYTAASSSPAQHDSVSSISAPDTAASSSPAQRDSVSSTSALDISAVASGAGSNFVEVEKRVGAQPDSLQAAKMRAEGELGDFIFSVVNAARLYHLNPDSALEMTNNKFIRRFNYVEARAKEMGRDLKELTLGEMDELWNRAKELERGK